MKKAMFLATAITLSLTTASPMLAQSQYKDCYYNGTRYSHGSTNPAGQTCDDGSWRG